MGNISGSEDEQVIKLYQMKSVTDWKNNEVIEWMTHENIPKQVIGMYSSLLMGCILNIYL
jgi:hypothetical protein